MLTTRLKHPDSYVRVCAALSLWHLDKTADSQSVASAALNDRRYAVRVVAAETVARFGKPDRAVAVLLDVLLRSNFANTTTDGNARFMVARALGRIGPSAKVAFPVLVDLLDDEDRVVRTAVLIALKRIDPDAAGKLKLP